MTVKRKTREQLEADLVDVGQRLAAMRAERDGAAQHAKELRSSLDNVKERLAFAEAELQRAGGYIQRVQEDDVVREDLVTVGEPGAEQHLVPKRKPTHFAVMSAARPIDQVNFESGGMMYRDCAAARPAKHRHWVTY